VAALISEVANKDGAAHLALDSEERRLLDAIAKDGIMQADGQEPADSISAKSAMWDLAQWAIKAIDHSLTPAAKAAIGKFSAGL
jgi:hypothetical protein